MKKLYKFKLDLVFLNIGSIVLFLICFIPVIIFNKDFIINFDFNLVVLLILWMGLHELLHGIGFGIFKGVNKNNIKYGIQLESGIFYCMCKQKISKTNILVSLMFPFTFIGVVTLILGLIFKNSSLIMLSLVNIAGAIGDLAMFISILLMPKNIEYIDLDDTTGFFLISSSDLSKCRLIGFKYDGCVDASEENLKSKERDKITVTKPSYIILFILLGLNILSNIITLITNLV